MRHSRSVGKRVVYLSISFLIYYFLFKSMNMSMNTSAYGVFIIMMLFYYLGDNLNFYISKYRPLDFIVNLVVNVSGFGIFYLFTKEEKVLFSLGIFVLVQNFLRYIMIKLSSQAVRTIIVGENGTKNAVEKILRKDEMYSYIGYIGCKSGALGRFGDLDRVIEEYSVHKIVLTESCETEEQLDKIIELRTRGVQISDYLSFMEKIEGKIDVHKIDKKWLAKTIGFGIFRNEFQRKIKRLADLSLACVIGILSLPVLAVVYMIIKVGGVFDKKLAGPLFFKQQRVGFGNKSFEIIKVRSMMMKEHWEAVGFNPTHEAWTEENDPRITKLGNFMRKTRIDELPQIINVLKGEMSFVGPRPESVTYVKMLEKELPFYNLRHTVRPGLTGWAQVMYPYGASVQDALHKLEYDLYYIKHQNFILDMMIFFKTLKTVVFGRGR